MGKWYIKDTSSKVYGPIDFETLKAWVKEGRVEPLAGISQDLANWQLAPLKAELEMNWVVENNPGQFYGPTHKSVLEDLVKSGAVNREARFYHDDRGALSERIRQLELAISERDGEISRRDHALQEAQKRQTKRDLELANAQKGIAQRDERISDCVAAVAQKDAQIEQYKKDLKLKDAEIAQRNLAIERKNAELENAVKTVEELQAQIFALKESIAARDAIREREWTTEVVEPEIVRDEVPPPVARKAFSFGPQGAGTNSALADLERRLQEEISRMGAAGVQRMFGSRG